MSDSPKWQAVAFTIREQSLLIAVSHIVEIIDSLPCTKIPETEPWFLGLASSRGNILAVSDLAGLLLGENAQHPKQGRLLLVRGEEDVFALLVDEVTGLKKFPVTALVANDKDTALGIKPYVLEYMRENDRVIPVFDPGLLVNSDRFLNASSTLTAA